MRRPHFFFERRLIAAGHRVVGVDEVGVGCIAGPVVAAAIQLPLMSRIGAIRDSKMLSAGVRMKIFERILELSIPFSIGIASAAEIDALNIRQATFLAMRRAIAAFPGATYALIDAWHIPGLEMEHEGVRNGDTVVKSIAAASIIAKVARDRLMEEYDREFPQYGFARHKGYGTKLHMEMLRAYGPSVLHRRSFMK